MLSQIAPTLVPRDTIYLSDHNSVTVPSRDISAPLLSPEHSTVIAAREAELDFLTKHQLIDTYACFHSGRHSDFDLEGWTWGFAPAKPTASTSPNLTANEHAPVLDRKRRIDRILLHENFQNSVAECYSRFVASSDQKAVIASLTAKPTKQGKRLGIPTAFLSSEETPQQLHADLQSIDTEGYRKWPDGIECIKTGAFSYEKANRATGITELQSLWMASSIHHLSEEAWCYLKEHGYTPSSAKAAYQILTAVRQRPFWATGAG